MILPKLYFGNHCVVRNINVAVREGKAQCIIFRHYFSILCNDYLLFILFPFINNKNPGKGGWGGFFFYQYHNVLERRIEYALFNSHRRPLSQYFSQPLSQESASF